LWKFPTYSPDAGSGRWLDSSIYQVTFDVTSQVRRDSYKVFISRAVGTDGFGIIPVSGYPFTVDYAGGIGDTTPPPTPLVTACSGSDLSSLSAHWSVLDPESTITMYSYAIGTTRGGAEVINWTNLTETSFTRSNLTLSPGQVVYIAVKARNAGGLWSEAGIPPGLAAGSGTCVVNKTSIYLPLAIR
jgi:hypothetical protein